MSAAAFRLSSPLLTALHSLPLRPFHALARRTEDKFRPARCSPYRTEHPRWQNAVIASGASVAGDAATLVREQGDGRIPTIVLGGFVPDAAEQVFLLRRFLLRSGDVYYVTFPRDRFSPEMIAAQLCDLVEDLVRQGRPPVILAVSFGAGLVVDWLRRLRTSGHAAPSLAGLVLISPVTCVDDLVSSGTVKPRTLLGRAIQPYLAPATTVSNTSVDKSRTIFLRMFDAGAQNKAGLRLLMSDTEVCRLREAVSSTIRSVTWDGARARVGALRAMIAPTRYFQPDLLPLSPAPTLVLFAEDENAVLEEGAPVRLALGAATAAYFPRGRSLVVSSPGPSKVQHASLIFHVFEFLPPLQAFYQQLRRAPAWPLAA